MSRRFQQVDVFSTEPSRGNPLAVVVDAEGLSDEEMQAFTRWMNLSETTFLLPPADPQADYRVRIFTPARELPFAGHPTLGSCHVWLATGNEPRDAARIVQECGAGLVTIRRDGDQLAFAAPPRVRTGPVEPAVLQDAAGVLGLDPTHVVEAAWVDNGPGWLGILLPSADAVLAVEPRRAYSGWLTVGLVGLYPEGAEFAYEVRGLFTDQHGTVREDPVTGSLNASVAQWLLETGRVQAPYVASQGTRVGAAGRIHIDTDESGEVWVGGAVVTRIDGTLAL